MTSGKLQRILLVDDHRDTVELITLLLIKRGYSVVPAHSVAEARDAVTKHQCDVLVSDVGLPDGSGIELMRELRKQYRIKGILVSGATDGAADLVAEGFKFVAKPVNLQSLVDALQSFDSE